MTIQTSIFEVVFYAIVLLFGLDFLLSGLKVIKEDTRAIERPRLLGLLIIRVMHISTSSSTQNKLGDLMFGLKNMGVYSIFGGVLLIIGSLGMISEILF